MNYEELKLFSKVLNNDISFEDFKLVAESENYSEQYLMEIWGRWCQNPVFFMISHHIGKDIFELIKTKMETEQILNIKK